MISNWLEIPENDAKGLTGFQGCFLELKDVETMEQNELIQNAKKIFS